MNIKKNLVGSLLLLGLCSVSFISCQQQSDLYGPSPSTTTTKDASKIFDFSTTGSAKLDVSYGMPGYAVKFAVYADYPYNADGTLKSVLQPIYAGVTDNNGKFSSTFQLPAAEDSVYLYTDYVGVPSCLKLRKDNGAFTYDASTYYSSTTRSGFNKVSRAMSSSSIEIENFKDNVGIYNGTSIYSLYNTYNTSDCTVDYWGEATSIGVNLWVPSNTHKKELYNTVSDQDLALFLNNVNQNIITGVNNTKYISDKDVTTNTTILKQTASGNKVDYVNIDLVMLHISGAYHNAVGYYYYPSDKPASELTASYIQSLPKYMVYPRMTNVYQNAKTKENFNTPGTMMRARLQYFGADYNQSGTDKFPAGYTIGWMLVPDLNGYDNGNNNMLVKDNIKTVDKYITSQMRYARYSNSVANTSDNKVHCISVYDATAKKTVVGIEDGGNSDYKDLLLYVESNVPDAIYDPARPVINPTNIPVELSFTINGTYAFEDIWPSGGDYDLNDVVVEYSTTVNSSDGYVTSIVDKYKVVTKKGGATYHNAFGYVINDNYGGTVTSDGSTFKQEESNQYIVFANANEEIGKTFTVTRTIPAKSLKASDYTRNYNPFIVVNYEKDAKNRVEVHLPKYAATSWASSNDGGDNAFYVDKEGKYPFAIDLNGVTDFNQVTEKMTIGSANEYPFFTKWVAEPTNAAYLDWYKYKSGK
jgi:LruC domain-containing protein